MNTIDRWRRSANNAGKTLLITVGLLGLLVLILPAPGKTATKAAPGTNEAALERAQRLYDRTHNSISADDLFNAYDTNEVAADRDYKARRMWVTGTIQDIGKDLFGAPYIALSVAANQFMSVHAGFPRGSEPELAALSPGRPITVVCTITGQTLTIVAMKDCEIDRGEGQ